MKKRTYSLPLLRIPEEYMTDARYLEARVMKRLHARERWGEPTPKEVLLRIRQELDVLAQGYPDYVLIVEDIVNELRKGHYPCEIVSGNLKASKVAQVLMLTYEDPLALGLRFDEFVNSSAAEDFLPEVGLRTNAAGRRHILAYLIGTYGREHVATIAGAASGVVLSGLRIRDVVEVSEGSEDVPEIVSPMREVLASGLVKFEIEAWDEHPIVTECLRETSGKLIFHEQLAEMIHLMAGCVYGKATRIARSLRARDRATCESLKERFLSDALANPMVRRGIWRDESFARMNLAVQWDRWAENADCLHSRTAVVTNDRLPEFVTKRIAVGAMTYEEVRTALDRGERAIVLVRHAERPPLAKDDPTHGADLDLTDRGRAEARSYGFLLAEMMRRHDARLYACSTKRCRKTALAFCRTADEVVRGVTILEELGSASPYIVGDVRTDSPSLEEATDAFEQILLDPSASGNKARFAVYVTHDRNVACFLAGRKVITSFDETNWPGYLDAAVMLLGRNGVARYGYIYRPRQLEGFCL